MSDLKPQVVFFGSGPVAAESLRLLIKHCEIEAVITKPSTVKDMAAIAKGECIYSVNNRAELDDLISARPFDSKLGILIDFGIIVSRYVIDSFEKGIINSHFSLLPQWRGADPISFSILSGQKKTGVSLMLLVEAMDEGPLLSIGEYELNGTETGPLLTEELVKLSDALLKDTIPAYLLDKPRAQTKIKMKPGDQIELARIMKRPAQPTYSRKLVKDDGILDFTKPAEQLEREIRAFKDWPKSRTEIAGKDVVILKASVDTSLSGKTGEIFITENKNIGIYTTKGALIIHELKPAGKQAMSAEGFLAGYGNKL